MHLIVIDPGFVGRGGHHVAINRFLVQEGLKRGLRPMVLGSQLIDPNPSDGFRCLPVFPFSPYNLHEDAIEYLKRFVVFNEETRTVLLREVPAKKLAPNSTLIVHTAFGCILNGLREYLCSIQRPDLRVRIVLRFPPRDAYGESALAKELWIAILRQWKDVPGDVQFFTDLQSLATWYQEKSHIKIGVTPIAVDFSHAPIPTGMRAQKGLTFASLGVPREEKGILIIADAMERHLQRHPEDRFLLHVPGAADHILEELKNRPPAVQLVESLLFDADYFSLISQSDVVLIPYLPQKYHFRTSHIFMEALGMAKAVVTTPNTWMAEQLNTRTERCGAIMPSVDGEGLLAAMNEIHQNRPEITKNTEKIAPSIRRQHCKEEWFRCVLTGASS